MYTESTACARECMLIGGNLQCVMLAGLCHDLGHGPFSHVFERAIGRLNVDYCHEEGSVAIFGYLLESNSIDLAEFGLEERDRVFVEECILGSDLKGGIAQRRGREREKHFLYDIVNNTQSGLDMDKLDYFIRDKHHCIGAAAGMCSAERQT